MGRSEFTELLREQGFQRGGGDVYEKNVCHAKLLKAGIEGYLKENKQNITKKIFTSNLFT